MKDASDIVNYKGFEIRALPEEVDGSEDMWSIQLYITSRSEGGSSREACFYRTTCYQTRKRAVEQCHIYGREIIDADVEGHSKLSLGH